MIIWQQSSVEKIKIQTQSAIMHFGAMLIIIAILNSHSAVLSLHHKMSLCNPGWFLAFKFFKKDFESKTQKQVYFFLCVCRKKNKAHRIAHIEHSSWFSNKLKGIGLPEFWEQPPFFKRQCKNPASSPCETADDP